MIKQVFTKSISIILMSAIIGTSLVGCDKPADSNLQEQKINELEAKVEILSQNQETKSNPTNEILDTSNEELRKLNTFLSNFSEIDFPNFSKDNYDEKQLIYFAIVNNYINNYENTIKEYSYIDGESRLGISASNVQNTIDRYFGFTVADQSIEHYEYYNGSYILPLADGATFPKFTQVKDIYRDGDIFRIKAEIYIPNNFDELADNSWRYEHMNRVPDFNEDITLVGLVDITLKLAHDNGTKRYKLIDYKVN